MFTIRKCMEPPKQNQPGRIIQPINEDALRQELAYAQPPAPSPIAQTPPQRDNVIDPASVNIGYNLQLDPIKPVATQPNLTNQQPAQAMNTLAQTTVQDISSDLIHDDPVKPSWTRLLITGASISLLFTLLLTNIQRAIAFSSGANPTPGDIVVAGGFLRALPYICGLFVVYLGIKFTRKLDPIHPNVLAIATLLSSIGLSRLINVPLNYGQPIGQAISTIFGSSAYLGYLMYVIGGVMGIIAITYLMKFLCPRILNNELFIFVILVVALIPIGVNNIVVKIQQNGYEAQAIRAAGNVNKIATSKQNISPTTTSVSPSTSSKPNITYNIPALDGSGKYNDGNISFSYPVSSAYELGKHTNWRYVNDANSFTSLFSADYATDPKTYAKTFGAEIRIITKTLYGGDSQASTGTIERDYVTKYSPKATIYDINTSDGSYAFGINSNNNSFDIEQFGAYFIKNKFEYHILLSSAPNDIPKYKPQLDLIISSFKFLK